MSRQTTLIARVALTAALLSAGITLAIDTLVDPFGLRAADAQEATQEQRAVANVLGCQRGNEGRRALRVLRDQLNERSVLIDRAAAAQCCTLT